MQFCREQIHGLAGFCPAFHTAELGSGSRGGWSNRTLWFCRQVWCDVAVTNGQAYRLPVEMQRELKGKDGPWIWGQRWTTAICSDAEMSRAIVSSVRKHKKGEQVWSTVQKRSPLKELQPLSKSGVLGLSAKFCSLRGDGALLGGWGSTLEVQGKRLKTGSV